ncbi:MAG: hypothetical protein GQ535_14490 [Rhodobacteraceae bacterium]|nr:hypothetical protein [Paracoccaceae bacterium]
MKRTLAALSLIALISASSAFAQSKPSNLAEALAQYLSAESIRAEEDASQFVNQFCFAPSVRQCLLRLSERLAPRADNVGETVLALQILAEVQADIGQTDAATATFAQAERLILRRFGGFTKELALADLSRSLINAGRYQQARRVSNEIEKEMSQVVALLEIANALLNAGNLVQGEATLAEGREALKAATIRGPRDSTRHFALSELAAGLTRLGQVDLAMDTISQIPDERRRASALQQFVEALLEIGRLALAQEITQGITQSIQRIKALTQLAEYYFAAGNLAEANRMSGQALSYAMQIEGAGARAYGIAFVAEALAKTGQNEKAKNLAIAIERPFEGAMTLSLVAAELAANGHREDALTLFVHAQEMAYSIESTGKKNTALADIGRNLAQAGFLAEALIASQASDSNYARSVVYANLARAINE